MVFTNIYDKAEMLNALKGAIDRLNEPPEFVFVMNPIHKDSMSQFIKNHPNVMVIWRDNCPVDKSYAIRDQALIKCILDGLKENQDGKEVSRN